MGTYADATVGRPVVHSARAARDTAAIFFVLVGAVALLLWAAWEIDFSLERTTFIRIITVIVFGSFALFTALFLALVYVQQINRHAGTPVSVLHRAMIVSTAAFVVFFGIASIPCVDFYHNPGQSWPLLRDPTVQLLAVSTVFVVAVGKTLMLYEILPPPPWIRRNR